MQQLAEIKTYSRFKEALGTELRNQAEGFVRTGYLLKRARDTDILKDSGYATVAEFALAEFDLTKDIVSRYIAINDRYSKDGYSEYLQERFEGYGVAKLQEMLTLPDSVVELMTPELTKREIQEVKKELKEEEKITDLEVLLEGNVPAQAEMTMLQKVLHQYFYEQREQYLQLEEVIERKAEGAEAIEKVLDVIAPTGVAIKTVRLQGVGKLMMSIKGKDNPVEVLNTRSGEKEEYTWQQFMETMTSVFGENAGIAGWEELYEEPFTDQEKEPGKVEVAPVQPIFQAEEKEGIVQKASKPEKMEYEKLENVGFVKCETILEQEEEEVVQKGEKTEPQEAKNVDFAECETILQEESKAAVVEEEDLREEARETAWMIEQCLLDWGTEEIPIEDIWKCIENAKKLLETLKKLENQKTINGGKE